MIGTARNSNGSALSLFRAASKLNAGVEVQPVWIVPFDQIDFPVAFPLLELFFTVQCCGRGFVSLKPNQPLDLVPFRESGNEAVFVLPNASREIGSRTDVM